MLAIYKASAGSGKTFTLAYEYIKMLLGVKDDETGRYSLNRNPRDRNRHRHILAITFTNKATDEMKRRIIHELAVLARLEPGWSKPSPYADRLCIELHCSSADLQTAAATALRQLLFDFNLFQVSTIDAFFQIILRTFAREVDIAGNYEVDLNNDNAIGQGVRELFDSLTVNSGSEETRRLISWITKYLLSELADGRQISLFNRSSHVHARFLKFINKIINDDFTAHEKDITDYIKDPEKLPAFATAINKLIKQQLSDSSAACSNALRIIRERGYLDGKLKVSANLTKQLELIAGEGRITTSAKSVFTVNTEPSKAYGKALATRLESTPDPELTDAIDEACRIVVSGESRLTLLEAIQTNLFVLGLLERVNFYVNRYRNENNTIYLSDTNALLREIIGDEANNGAPFVYERVGLWINHFLIDEFQDTSGIQWENLSPLLHEGKANGNDSLIIGDEKQCIYRFRFSDPTLLQNKVQQEFKGYARIQGDDSAGNTNWRSSADIVRFNNDLFSAMASNLGFTDIYSNVVQQVSPKHSDHRGYISFTGLRASTTEEYQSEALRVMTEEILRQLRAGYRPCDIAILTRFTSEGTAAITHLMDASAEIEELRDVRIMSDDAMMVESAPAVRLIVSVLRFLADHDESGQDTEPGKTARRRDISLLINRYEHLISQGLLPDRALSQALEAKSDGSDLTDRPKESANPSDIAGSITGTMTCFNLPSLVERIIVRFISPEIAENQNMYISAFVDVVTEYCSRGTADLREFLNWWNDTGRLHERVAAPFDERAIRVMTIHKSKGLEFKCTHVPFINYKMVSFKDLEWFDTEGCFPEISAAVPPMLPMLPAAYMAGTPFAGQYEKRCREQMLDELNVLYVALTRAVDELIVGYRISDSKDSASQASSLLRDALGTIEMEVGKTDSPDDADVSGMTTEHFFRGTPTTPHSDDVKERTALDPTGTFEMHPYETADRDDLWANLDIDRYIDYGQARERGIVLHDVLAHVAHTADLPAAIRTCSYRGRLPREEADAVKEYLEAQLRHPEIQLWFENYRRVLRERPLVLANGEVRRPDRVVWTSDGHVDVIDYKFGSERPAKYARQVTEYMDALTRQGHSNVRGFIWYVDSGQVVAVDRKPVI